MLNIYHSVTDLNEYLETAGKASKSVGFVPTMGALHAGHMSLIEESSRLCDITVCSIFVNPTQFNDPSDYTKYPRNIESDKIILENSSCTCLFVPDVSEIYPDASYKQIRFNPGPTGALLEGAHRPGHFNGMVAVVKRLLDIVMPQKAFFGQKDYQQYLIVKMMTSFYQMPVEIVKCATVREPNGLAMSSRNQRLTAEERENATIIYKTLIWAKQQITDGKLSFETIEKQAMFDLKAKGKYDVDYFDICSAETLEKLNFNEDKKPLIILTAVRIRDIRLIDNILV